jgi:hypothetical protein
MVAVAGVTAIDATVSVVSVADPDCPPKSAVMVVGPATLPDVASPVLSMFATPVTDEFHVANFVKSWAVPPVSVPIAANCNVVAPVAMVWPSGLTAMDATSSQLSVVEPETPARVAEIVVEPRADDVASPLLSMVATPVFEELHETELVMSACKLLEYVPVAENCCAVPAAMLGF